MKIRFSLYLLCLLFIGCNTEPNHKERQAVRDYLASLNHQVIEEINWGEPDSVFSSYSLQIARDYFTTKAWNQIDELYVELFTLNVNSSQHKILADSISKLRAEITSINDNADAKIREAKPNRIGIEFKYILDNGGHADFIFIFNESGNQISHVQTLNGYYVELKKDQK